MNELNKFVYEIYPKSFKDSTGSGVGDLQGIIEKLPYISELGVDYIWLTPIYVSPQKDNGYDVQNYYEIDPLFGTKDDFDELIKTAKEYDIKIMMDMVFNHTSDQHEWFCKAVAGEEKYEKYYIFKQKDEITNWESKFGGNTWEYCESLDKYYLHLFDKSQPDLNWENEEVRKEIYKVVNYWIEQGVKGFRFDVVNLISKKYPLKDSTGDGREQYTDGPRVHEFLKELRTNTFGTNEGILTVGEMSSTSIKECVKYANSNKEELDSVFHFHHLKVDYKDGEKWSKDFFDFKMLKGLMKDWQQAMERENVVDTLFWSNHDQPRVASRFVSATSKEEQLRKNKTLAVLMYFQKGISYIYQGEEIGMENLKIESIEDLVDVESKNYYKLSSATEEEKLKILEQKSRDNSRTPMQWDSSENGGFSSSVPWIAINKKYKTINVKDQVSDESSTLSFYKKVIRMKKSDEVLINGVIEHIDHEELFIYTRTLENKVYTIICNIFAKEVEYNIGKTLEDIVLNNGVDVFEDKLVLKPFSSIVLTHTI